jgi:plasmid stability protein
VSAERPLTHQIVVRVDDDLRVALVRDAAANGRTVAQSVRHLLRQELAGARLDVDGIRAEPNATRRATLAIRRRYRPEPTVEFE